MGVSSCGPTGAGGLSPHAWRPYGKGTRGHGTHHVGSATRRCRRRPGATEGHRHQTLDRGWERTAPRGLQRWRGRPPGSPPRVWARPGPPRKPTRGRVPAPRALRNPSAQWGVPTTRFCGLGCEVGGRSPVVAEARGRARRHSPWSEDAPSKPQVRRVLAPSGPPGHSPGCVAVAAALGCAPEMAASCGHSGKCRSAFAVTCFVVLYT